MFPLVLGRRDLSIKPIEFILSGISINAGLTALKVMVGAPQIKKISRDNDKITDVLFI